MTKKADTLAALRDIKRAVLQGRDNAVNVVSLMIKNLETGEDLKPLPAPEARVRTPMAPMATGPKPAPVTVLAPKPETVAVITPVPVLAPEPETVEERDQPTESEAPDAKPDAA